MAEFGADVNANIGINIDSTQALAQLKLLQKQISDFNLSIAKSNQAAALAQQSLQKNLVNSINAIGSFTAELRTVNTTAEAFTASLEGNKFSLREYFRYAGAATKTFGKSFTAELDTINKVAEERVKRLQTQYIKMGRDASGAMKAIAVMPAQLDMGNLATQTQIAAQKQALFNQLLKQGSTQLLNFGKNTQWAGRQLMVGFTLPLAMFGSTAAKAFQTLETEVIKFKKVYGDLGTSTAQTEQALKNIKLLADGYTKYGVEVSKTVAVASQAAAAGFQNADLIAQTDAATKLAILGQIDQQQALETTISLQNAFKISSTELASTIDFLNAVENQTVTSLDDITTAIPKVAPVIQSLGGDVKDLAFFLTAMKEGGVNASEGANALKSGLASLINPTKKASDMLAGYGINIQNIVNRNAGNLKQTVVEFARELDKLDPLARAKAIETMFGKFQFARISTLLSNVTQTGNQASRVLDLAGQSASNLASITQKELGVTAESAMVKFQASMAKLRASLAPVGEVFLKAFTPVIDFISKVIDKFNGLGDNVKKAIAITVGVIGGVGPIVLMTVGLIANGIANIIKLFTTLRSGFQRLTGQSQNLGEQTQYLTTEQLDAAAAAHSLEQSHARLTQQFTVEATAVNELRIAYQQALAAGAAFAFNNPGMMKIPKAKLANGIRVVPGSGNQDSFPAMLMPGEAVIPTKMTQKYSPLINGMIADNIPGFAGGWGGSAGKYTKSISDIKDVVGLYKSPSAVRSQTRAMTWETLAAEQEAMTKAAGDFLAASGFSATQITKKLKQMTQVQASHITQEIQQIEVAGKTIDVKIWNADNLIAELGGINNYLNSIHKISKTLSSSDIAQMASELGISVKEFEIELAQLEAGVQAITPQSQNVLRSIAERGKLSKNPILAYQSYGVAAALDVRGPVVDPRRMAYDSQKNLIALEQTIEKTKALKIELLNSLSISNEVATVSGKNIASLQSAYDSLDIMAKERLAVLINDTQAFTVALLNEAKTAGLAGFELGSAAVRGVAKGAQTASPSKITRKTGLDIANGLILGMQQGTPGVIAESEALGMQATTAVSNGAMGKNKTKRKFGPGFGFTKAGMAASMGMMVGSMALSAVPEFPGKNYASAALNFGSMGAMFGGGFGAIAGVALGLVSTKLSEIIEKQKMLKAMSEAVFKPSADLATYFGNEIVSVDAAVSNFNVTMGYTSQAVKNAGNAFGYTTDELVRFREMVDSLPQGNPLKSIIEGLTKEGNPEKIARVAKEFVTTQVALGQLKPDQAQKTINLILASSNHLAMVGSTFITFKDQADAITQTLKNAGGNSKVFGEQLIELNAAAANSTSLEQLQAIIDGVASSGITAAKAIGSMYNAYLAIGNINAAKAMQLLMGVQGLNAQDVPIIMAAINAGWTKQIDAFTNGTDLVKEAQNYLLKNGTSAMQSFNSKASAVNKTLKDQNALRDIQIKKLEEEKKKIDDRLKNEQLISEELKRQNDYTSKQADLDQKIAEAKMSGNYIEAANLQQQKNANTAQFNYDTRIADLQKQSDSLASQIQTLKDANDANTKAIDKNTQATQDNTTAIGTSNQGGLTGGATGLTSANAVPIGSSASVDAYVNSKKAISPGWNPRTESEIRQELDPSYAYKYWKSGGATVLKDYILRQFQGQKLERAVVVAMIGSDGKTYQFKVQPDKTIIRMAMPEQRADGGIIQRFGSGSTGAVSGPGTSTSDSIPAYLSDGEYVIKASSVDKYGVSFFDSLNAGKFASGGHARSSSRILSPSHMSNSKINKNFITNNLENNSTVTEKQINAMLEKQGMSGGKWDDSRIQKLPSEITKGLIDSIVSNPQKPGTLGGYQYQAIEAMLGSGRSMDFIINHLNDATAMRMPNYNLPGKYAFLAGTMARSGRTKDFIREKLGLSSDVYVPGRSKIQRFAGGGMPNPITMGWQYFYDLIKRGRKNLLGFDTDKPLNKWSNMEKVSLATVFIPGGKTAGEAARLGPKLINPVKASSTIMRNVRAAALENALSQGRKVPNVLMQDDRLGSSMLRGDSDLGAGFKKYWVKAFNILKEEKNPLISGMSEDDFIKYIATSTEGPANFYVGEPIDLLKGANPELAYKPNDLIKAANSAYLKAHGLDATQKVSMFRSVRAQDIIKTTPNGPMTQEMMNNAILNRMGGYWSIDSRMAASFLRNLGSANRPLVRENPIGGLYRTDLPAEAFGTPIGTGGWIDEYANVIDPHTIAQHGISRIGYGWSNSASNLVSLGGPGPQRYTVLGDFYKGVPFTGAVTNEATRELLGKIKVPGSSTETWWNNLTYGTLRDNSDRGITFLPNGQRVITSKFLNKQVMHPELSNTWLDAISQIEEILGQKLLVPKTSSIVKKAMGGYISKFANGGQPSARNIRKYRSLFEQTRENSLFGSSDANKSTKQFIAEQVARKLYPNYTEDQIKNLAMAYTDKNWAIVGYDEFLSKYRSVVQQQKSDRSKTLGRMQNKYGMDNYFGVSGFLKSIGIPGLVNGGMIKNYSIPSYDIGTPYVPEDTLAMLHKGERVVTAEENKNYNSGDTITISPIFNITGSNSEDIVNQVMVKLNTISNRNNKGNKVVF